MIAGVPWAGRCWRWRPSRCSWASRSRPGASRPRPVGRAHGLLQPTDMYHRTLACIDSASVRLHYTTRTLARASARRWSSRSARGRWRALFGPACVRPGDHAARDLSPGRGRVPDRPAHERRARATRRRRGSGTRAARSPCRCRGSRSRTRAARRRRTCSSRHRPRRGSRRAWRSTDAARLARPAELERKALDIALEGEKVFASANGVDDSRGAREQASYIDARVGVSMVGLGYHNDDAADAAGRHRRSRRALVHVDDVSDDAAQASHLHELGVGEVRGLDRARPSAARFGARAPDARLRHPRLARLGHEPLPDAARAGAGGAARGAARPRARRGGAPSRRRGRLARGGHRSAGRTGPQTGTRRWFTLATLALEIDRACVSRDTTAFGASAPSW